MKAIVDLIRAVLFGAALHCGPDCTPPPPPPPPPPPAMTCEEVLELCRLDAGNIKSKLVICKDDWKACVKIRNAQHRRP